MSWNYYLYMRDSLDDILIIIGTKNRKNNPVEHISDSLFKDLNKILIYTTHILLQNIIDILIHI